jgi:hypothetical protein
LSKRREFLSAKNEFKSKHKCVKGKYYEHKCPHQGDHTRMSEIRKETEEADITKLEVLEKKVDSLNEKEAFSLKKSK